MQHKFAYFSITIDRGMKVLKCSLTPRLWALSYLVNSFAFDAPIVWNELPDKIRRAIFTKGIKIKLS